MKYLDRKFSVAAPGTKQYADNWDRVFGKKCPHAVRQAHQHRDACVCAECGETIPCNAEPAP